MADEPIKGLGLSLFRSFGNTRQLIGPLRKINFFVRQNNCGKSNILRFLKNHYGQMLDAVVKKTAYGFKDFDVHIGEKGTASAFSLAVGINGRFDEAFARIGGTKERLEKLISKVLSDGLDDESMGWIHFNSVNGDRWLIAEDYLETVRASTVLNKDDWRNLWSALHEGRSNANVNEVCIPETLDQITRLNAVCPNVELISAVRQIGPKGVEAKGFDGIGIIDRLSRLQNPPLANRKDKEKFRAINELLKKVTGNPTAQLEIPVDMTQILVDIDGKTLAIEDLGTGIHEVVILAAAATVLDNQILCIEEPELHLHPLLQKKLIRYLQTKTTNQYFFTTHSAHLLDTPDASVFHVRLIDGMTQVERADSPARRSSVCFDLGYLASDLLQANCVIWVEGPSDRIYLNHWITAVDSKLEENIHYSIMFYGGRLLSHLSASDYEVKEFISLRRLNRHTSILIDSDKDKPQSRVRETKMRVKKEFDDGPGFTWITKGREIENYIDPAVLLAAIQKIHPSAARLVSKGQFDQTYYYKTATGKVVKTNIDKVKISHEVVKVPADLNILDLKTQLNKLVAFIKDSNDTEPYFLE